MTFMTPHYSNYDTYPPLKTTNRKHNLAGIKNTKQGNTGISKHMYAVNLCIHLNYVKLFLRCKMLLLLKEQPVFCRCDLSSLSLRTTSFVHHSQAKADN